MSALASARAPEGRAASADSSAALGAGKENLRLSAILGITKTAKDVAFAAGVGGNTKNLKRLPPGVRLGTNAHAILGGFRLWNEPARKRPPRPQVARSPRKATVKGTAGGDAPSPASA